MDATVEQHPTITTTKSTTTPVLTNCERERNRRALESEEAREQRLARLLGAASHFGENRRARDPPFSTTC